MQIKEIENTFNWRALWIISILLCIPIWVYSIFFVTAQFIFHDLNRLGSLEIKEPSIFDSNGILILACFFAVLFILLIFPVRSFCFFRSFISGILSIILSVFLYLHIVLIKLPTCILIYVGSCIIMLVLFTATKITQDNKSKNSEI